MHKAFVLKYIKKIINDDTVKLNSNHVDKLNDRACRHDNDKLNDLFKPYVFVTWKYKVGKEQFEKVDVDSNFLNNATFNHIKSNKHHPQFWDDNSTIQNEDDPKIIVDATKMDCISLIEMCAMSQQLRNCPLQWAKTNINVKWRFSQKQIEFIFKILTKMWR